jgi:hypothetical protein
MAVFMDLKGTSQLLFQLGKGGPKLKNASGLFEARNAADSAYVDLTAAILKAASDSIELNSDAAGSGADWKMTLARPASGMTAAVTYTLPAAPVNGYVLSTDGSGALSWVAPASTSNSATADSTTVLFTDSSPVSLFTLPANALIDRIQIIIDTPFDDAATITVQGVTSSRNYALAGESDLQGAARDVFQVHPGFTPDVASDVLQATLTPGSSTQGECRVVVYYVIPS